MLTVPTMRSTTSTPMIPPHTAAATIWLSPTAVPLPPLTIPATPSPPPLANHLTTTAPITPPDLQLLLTIPPPQTPVSETGMVLISPVPAPNPNPNPLMGSSLRRKPIPIPGMDLGMGSPIPLHMGSPIPLRMGPVDTVDPLKKGMDPGMGSHRGTMRISHRTDPGMGEQKSSTGQSMDPVMGDPKERSSRSMVRGMEQLEVKDMDLGTEGPRERTTLLTGLDTAVDPRTYPVMEGPKGRISLPMATVVMKRRNPNRNLMDMVRVRKVMVEAGMVVVTQATLQENIRATVERRKDTAVRNMMMMMMILMRKKSTAARSTSTAAARTLMMSDLFPLPMSSGIPVTKLY